MPHRQLRRPTAVKRAGDDRAAAVARRIGLGLRDCRVALRLTQTEAGGRAGISQSAWSRIERGASASVSIQTMSACAAAVDAQLAGFIEARPGSSLPRDVEHLRRQELVIGIARAGGWTARPEHPIDAGALRSRSIDVDLVRRAGAEEVVVEIEDLLTDGGGVLRSLTDKVAAIRRAAPTGTAVRGLLIIRATRRNRETISAFPGVFASRFPGASVAWLRALTDPAAPLPGEDGMLWSSTQGDRLTAVRLPTPSVPR